MSFRLIDLAKPFGSILPEIEGPYTQLNFDEKVVYTMASAIIYILAQLPLAGVSQSAFAASADPIYWLRPIFAAERGTLLEFGVFPIISTGLILQLLASLRLIRVNFTVRSERELFQNLQKIFALFQYFALTNLFLLSGYFGTGLSLVQVILINVQIFLAGGFFTLISEVIDKGYGFGSGALTFTAVNVATNFVGDVIGINSIETAPEVYEKQGALANLISGLGSKGIFTAIWESFTRTHLPNLIIVLICIAIVLACVYLQNLRYDLSIRSNKARGVSSQYPIKLLYTGALPLVFSFVLLFYINVIAYVTVVGIFNNDSEQLAVKILGHYTANGSNFSIDNLSLFGLFSPASSLIGSLLSPIRTIVFSLFVVYTSVKFAQVWSVTQGSGPRDIAAQFKEQGVTIYGVRDVSIAKYLKDQIPTAAVTGALCLAGLSIAGEFLGTNGRASGIVVAVGVSFSFLEIIASDYQQSGGSQNFGQIFGGF
ncbi:hypothetical protein WICPIJ_007777 [Wickerhamomyces pijperi]|uniref:Translocon Sec61/SecY plug domain-containing protein n=1 Tax=Wickerhamomyces pijperi TaxID=599730 RepID=A0A9P8PZA0_WICPI|nr:hypothetical protein WICPIJ_007777 [Wickerhamomyces pijperi]